MKKLLSIFAVLLTATLILTSCSKDKSPADSDLFVGTYNGSISYVASGETKSAADGKVTVTKVGDTYSFAFSDGIPNIYNIKFEKGDDEYYINIGGSGTSYIRINNKDLKILYISDGQTWTANCTR